MDPKLAMQKQMLLELLEKIEGMEGGSESPMEEMAEEVVEEKPFSFADDKPPMRERAMASVAPLSEMMVGKKPKADVKAVIMKAKLKK